MVCAMNCGQKMSRAISENVFSVIPGDSVVKMDVFSSAFGLCGGSFEEGRLEMSVERQNVP